jgi:hypothetical protein
VSPGCRPPGGSPKFKDWRPEVDALAVQRLRLAKLEVRVVRENPRLPDLAQTGRIYRELLAAFFIANLPPETLERAATAVKDLPADDQSLAAGRLRVISGCAGRSAAWQVNLIKRTRRTRARRFSDPPPTGCQRVRRARFNFRTRWEANKLPADRAVSAK